jgi:hypothetical protein
MTSEIVMLGAQAHVVSEPGGTNGYALALGQA